MKFRFFIAAALLLGLAVGCEQQEISTLDEIQISQSYASLDVNGGTTTIDINATESWQVVESSVPSWLTVSPRSGAAGQSKITLSADATKETNEADIQIVCAGKTQHINVIQFAVKGDPVILTCREAIDLIKSGNYGGAEYYVKGTVCRIDEIDTGSYGNATFYLSDDGTFSGSYNADGSGDGNWFEVYRAFWLNGAKFSTGKEFAVGDEITVLGVLTSYKGTPETLQDNAAGIAARVVVINPSLIKVDEVPEEPIALEGGSFDVKLTCKGDGISVNIPDAAKSWLSVTGINTSGTTATVTFVAAPNTGGDRSVELTFVTTSAGKTYSSVATIAQTGAIIDCTIAEYLAAAEDDTQYRISGIITSVAQDSEKYGANLYIKDATGETYIYGTTDATGAIQTLASFGAKEGDIIEFVGKRSSYKGTPQMAKGVFQSYKTVTPVKAADVAALADDDKNDPRNYISLTGVVSKNPGYEIAPYGNFDLVDDSGSILVYGVSTGWKGATKQFESLGVKEGDTITIVAYKTSYKGNAQVVGMYVSHESGSTQPDQPDQPTSTYSIDLAYTLGANAYDDGVATINGEEGCKVLKIGTSSKVGEMTLTVPAGTTKLTFYAVAWKGNATTVEFYNGETLVASKDVAANDGASNNSPYTINVTDADKYVIENEFASATTLKVTTAAEAKTRAIFFGIKAE